MAKSERGGMRTRRRRLLRRLARRRRREPLFPPGDDGFGPPDGGVREPRRPKPTPPSAAMAIEEDGEAVQS